MAWPDYEKIRWRPDGNCDPPSDRVGVWPENADLHAFLVDLSGRYLRAVERDRRSAVEFTYCLFVQGGQESGFLRLDVNQMVVVAGFDREKTGPEAITAVAVRYAAFAEMGSPISVLPLITAGATNRYAYYITSPYGLSTAYPEMVRAALRYIADYLVLPGCGGDRAKALAYAEGMKKGDDPQKMLEIEPLIASVIESAPAETRSQARRELAGGIAAALRE